MLVKIYMNFDIGNKIGYLTIIGKSRCIDKKHSIILVRCDCGKEWESRRDSIVRGSTISCGCIRKKAFINRNTTHGQCSRIKRSGAYKSYHDMMQRCTNPNTKVYKYYGARGITISCAEAERHLEIYQGAISCRVRRNQETHQEAVDYFIKKKGLK